MPSQLYQPTFSILFPVFNGSRYLREALDTVLGQSFADYELLICDDCSSDDSSEILADYSDPRIQLIQHSTNQGLFPTLNELVTKAKGQIVRLWSQDDRMKPHCLETEWRFWQAHPEVAQCYCGGDTIDESGTVVYVREYDPTPDVVEPWLVAQISTYHGCMAGNIARMSFRKSVLDEVGPFIMKVSGDFEMFVRIAGRYPTGYIRDRLVEVRNHPGQFSRQSGSAVVAMRENRQIFEELHARLPSQLFQYAKRYHQRHQYRLYFHHAVRSLLAGRIRIATDVIRFLSEVTNPLIPGFWWLVTANGRWLRLPPRYLSPNSTTGSTVNSIEACLLVENSS
jgi:glycosyltransferase involved in cell wall biosynthesis